MPASITDARDQMSKVLRDALLAATAPIDFSGTKVLWDDVDADPPATTETWVRHMVRHAGGGQSSLSDPNNKRRYTRTGIVAVQVFTRKGSGHSTSDALVGIITHAYEHGSTSGGVWFRNVRPSEQGVRGGWQQTDVYAEFTYDEVH